MLSPVIEVLAGELVRTTQEGPADATSDNMKTAVLSGRGDLGASVGHVDSVRDASDRGHRKNTYSALGN